NRQSKEHVERAARTLRLSSQVERHAAFLFSGERLRFDERASQHGFIRLSGLRVRQIEIVGKERVRITEEAFANIRDDRPGRKIEALQFFLRDLDVRAVALEFLNVSGPLALREIARCSSGES